MQVARSGFCLSFADGMARAMMRPLEEDGCGDAGVSGICYTVRVRRTTDDDDDATATN